MTEEGEANKYIKCSSCRCKYVNDEEQIDKHFGFNRLCQRYKTCVKCRSKKKQKTTHVETPAKTTPSFLESYVRLPIMKLEAHQCEDMRLDAIVVLNHGIEFEPQLRRYDNNMFSYKEFTQLDSIEYAAGVDPKNDYMPDEMVTPVLLKINGITYRASCLTWFPLTDCSDAIKLKQHETNQKVYPIFIKKGQSPIPKIMNATGHKYHQRLPSTEGFLLHQGYTDSAAVSPIANMDLVGENRNFGGSILYKDLIPTTSWFNNVRKCVARSSWDKLRRQVYERVDYRSECCNTDCKNRAPYEGDEFEETQITPAADELNGTAELNRWNTVQLEAHERWSFDNESKTQKLERLVALCHRCHTATHLGLADLRGLKQLALKHMMKVNKWNEEQLKRHNEEQTSLWRERNNIKWNLNIDIITKSGYQVKKPT